MNYVSRNLSRTISCSEHDNLPNAALVGAMVVVAALGNTVVHLLNWVQVLPHPISVGLSGWRRCDHVASRVFDVLGLLDIGILRLLVIGRLGSLLYLGSLLLCFGSLLLCFSRLFVGRSRLLGGLVTGSLAAVGPDTLLVLVLRGRVLTSVEAIMERKAALEGAVIV